MFWFMTVVIIGLIIFIAVKYNMSQNKKAAIATTKYSISTSKTADEIMDAIARVFFHLEKVDGPGSLNLYNVHYNTIIEFYYSEQGGGLNLLEMRAVPQELMHKTLWRGLMVDVYKNMQKIEKRLS